MIVGDTLYGCDYMTDGLILAQLPPQACEQVGMIHLLEPTDECFGREMVWSQLVFPGDAGGGEGPSTDDPPADVARGGPAG